MDKAKFSIQVETDGTCGYYAAFLQAMWFTAAVIFGDEVPEGTKRSFKQEDYKELALSGVAKITISVKITDKDKNSTGNVSG